MSTTRVLLQVVTLARDVAGDFHAVGEAHAADLAERRVRLLRRRRCTRARRRRASAGTILSAGDAVLKRAASRPWRMSWLMVGIRSLWVIGGLCPGKAGGDTPLNARNPRGRAAYSRLLACQDARRPSKAAVLAVVPWIFPMSSPEPTLGRWPPSQGAVERRAGGPSTEGSGRCRIPSFARGSGGGRSCRRSSLRRVPRGTRRRGTSIGRTLARVTAPSLAPISACGCRPWCSSRARRPVASASRSRVRRRGKTRQRPFLDR